MKDSKTPEERGKNTSAASEHTEDQPTTTIRNVVKEM